LPLLTREEARAPITGVTCARCGAGGCIAYQGKDDGSPSMVCPRCSTPVVEEILRAAAVQQGDPVGEARVFPAPADPMAEYKSWAAELPDWAREDLEAAWHACEDGSDCTAHFGYTEDGQTGYFEGGPRPSYALSILFDRENFAAGREHVLPWVADEAPDGEVG
jgi:hypothetical protein